MSKGRLIGLAPIVAVATLSVVPALAQAAPQFQINGVPVLRLGSKQNVLLSGSMTINNAFLGAIKCDVLEGAQVWNGSERGLADIEGYTAYDCTTEPPCKGIFATAEMPVEVTERENPVTKKLEKVAQPGPSTLPWSGEAVEEEGTEKRKKFKMNRVRLTIVAPCFNIEQPVEGTLEPYVINGSKNGLHPTHLEFPGKGGVLLCEGGKCIEVEASRLTMAGELSQLITVE
jgi:hypothetical protein